MPNNHAGLEPNATDQQQIFVGVKGLVYVGQQIIVYRRSADAPRYPLLLDVPGGGREGNEAPTETFIRETKEEFGLQLKLADIVYSRRYEASDGSGDVGYYMVAKLPASHAQDIRFGDEGISYQLMNVHDFIARTDAWPAYQTRAQHYLDSLQ